LDDKEGLRGDVDKVFTPRYLARLIRPGRDKCWRDIEAILRRVSHFDNLYYNVEGQQKAISEGTQPPFWSLSPKIAMTFIAIGVPMVHVATEIYGYGRYASLNGDAVNS